MQPVIVLGVINLGLAVVTTAIVIGLRIGTDRTEVLALKKRVDGLEERFDTFERRIEKLVSDGIARLEVALRDAYGFDARDFGQPVTLDGVYAVIQDVEGVIASDIDRLFRVDTGPATIEPQPRLLAALPAVQSDGAVNPAELLTLDRLPLELEAMP